MERVRLHTTFTVGTASTKILLAKPKRRFMFIKNISGGGETVTLQFGSALLASANNGIRLNDGDAIVENNSYNFDCWDGEVFAIGDGAGSAISVCEE